MPFTFAHPMVVLPVLRARWLDATCLVIGATAPDFDYFIHGEQSGNFGHTLIGVALFGVPITLIAAALFHGFVRDALLLVAPVVIARRVAIVVSRPRARWPAAPLIVLVTSAVIGNLTHLAWDGFTHDRGWGVRWFPRLLATRVDVPVIGSMGMDRVIQYASSVIGLVVVALVVTRVIRRRRAIALPEAPRTFARVTFAACALVGIAAVTARVIYIVHATDIGSLVVAPISGLLAGTLVASALLHARARAWRLQIERVADHG